MDDAHREALDDATAPDERWDTLAGHLYDPQARDGDVCPEEIVEFVAQRFVFTSEGRLFYLKANGEVTERSADATGQFNLVVDGTRWQPRQSALFRRIFPDRIPPDAEAPEGLEDYDPDDERPDWLGDLKPKTRPNDADVKHLGALT